ncbi:UNVERIFIED_CONTAM: Callose synthase 3 [Sesamum radiatum]|uniref:Callose synthase 3 n=1 Tax=Sesamum radiatum TaxID=300843 RepID=A0AAW2UR03_SESRA
MVLGEKIAERVLGSDWVLWFKMAFELYGMLAGNVSPMTGENVKPAYGGEEEAFLKKVVTPIYEVIAREAARSKKAKSKHSQWRNYDDLNEYFWSVDCFRLGWPMRADADFFCKHVDQLQSERNEWVYPLHIECGYETVVLLWDWIHLRSDQQE